MSPTNWAWPRSFSRASRRGDRAADLRPGRSRAASGRQSPRPAPDRLEDRAVAGAAAEVAGEAALDLLARVSSSPEASSALTVSSIAGRAEAALERGVARERLLEPLELGPLGEALDRRAPRVRRRRRRGSSRRSPAARRRAPCRRRTPGRRRSASRPSAPASRGGSRAAAPAARRRGRTAAPLTLRAISTDALRPRGSSWRCQASQYSATNSSRYFTGCSCFASSASIGRSSPKVVCDRLEPRRPLERGGCQHGPRNVLADDEHAVVAHQHGAPRAEGRATARPCRRSRSGRGRRNGRPRRRTASPSCVSSTRCGGGRAERGRVRRMAVDDRAHVGPHAVHLGVQHRLEVEHARRCRRPTTTSSGVDLVQRDALALDPDRAVGAARADVAEREVGVALARRGCGRPTRPARWSDCARPPPLTPFRRRVVGVREAEDHHHVLVAGVRDGVPDAGRDVKRVALLERHRVAVEPELARCRDTTYATSSVSCFTGVSSVPGVKTE